MGWARPWVTGGVVFGVSVVGFALAGVPTPPLFAALLGAGVVAVRQPGRVALPPPARTFAMVVVGVAAGARVDADVLRHLAERPATVLIGVLLTLSVTMLCGQLLRLHRDVSGATATFASIAGGASGVSMIARELGADEAVVLSVQYLRVIIVLVSVPLVAPLLGDAGGAALPAGEAASGLDDHVFLLLAGGAGLVLAITIRFSAAAIIFPLLTSCVLAVSGWLPGAEAPAWILAVAFAFVGLDVGLSMTRERIRLLARLLPLAALQAVLGMAICAVVGVLLADAIGISRIDGYLATTPGGLPAVIAVAIESGEDLGLILAVQFVRLFLALLSAPLFGWLFKRTRE